MLYFTPIRSGLFTMDDSFLFSGYFLTLHMCCLLQRSLHCESSRKCASLGWIADWAAPTGALGIVQDMKSSEDSLSIETPVLSKDLSRWGCLANLSREFCCMLVLDPVGDKQRLLQNILEQRIRLGIINGDVDLSMRGLSFTAALGKALENLRARTKKGPSADKCDAS